MKDRRAVFFFGAAVVCAVLIPATNEDLRWVPISMTIAYAVLGVLSYLDFWSRRRADPDEPTT